MQKSQNKYIKKYRAIRTGGIAALSALILLVLSTIIPVYFESETVEGTAGVVETPTLSMVVGQESANLDIVVNSGDGTFASSPASDKASFNITTSNYTGYTLTISASDDKGLLTNSNTGDSLSSIGNNMDESTFDTASNNGKWGYLPSKYYDDTTGTVVDNTGTSTSPIYLKAPTTTATTLDITSSANTTANNYTIGLGARVDYTLASGTYTNTYILTATANPVAYHIYYYDGINEASIGEQQSETSTASVTINPTYTSGSAPVRDTYTLVGWCDQMPTADSNNYFPATVCNGNKYTTTLPIDPTLSNNDLKLYAVWKPTSFDDAYAAAGAEKVSGYYIMQDMSKYICAAVTINQKIQLLDNRENNINKYYVAKLKDGKCWMIQNLRLGSSLTTATQAMSLSTNNSNVSGTFSLTNYVASGKMPYRPKAESGITYYVWDGPAFYCTADYGCYYNWFTATAGQGRGGDDIHGYTATPANTSVGYDICPSNWRLPTGTSNGESVALIDAYGGAGAAALNAMLVDSPTTTKENDGTYMPGFLLSGGYNSNEPYRIGIYGFYQSSSTSYATGFSSTLFFNANNPNVKMNNDNKAYAWAIRCIAK